MTPDPLAVARQDYRQLIEQISLPDSPVGIDAQYTHAIIITYLQQIAERLDRIEQRLAE
jgi:hypothetical protein